MDSRGRGFQYSPIRAIRATARILPLRSHSRSHGASRETHGMAKGGGRGAVAAAAADKIEHDDHMSTVPRHSALIPVYPSGHVPHAGQAV